MPKLRFIIIVLYCFGMFQAAKAQEDTVLQSISSLPIYEQADELIQQAKSIRSSDVEKADLYKHRVVELTEQVNDSLKNLIFRKLGDYFKTDGAYDSAQHYYNLSKYLSEQMKDSINLGHYYRSVGNLMRAKGMFTESSDHYYTAIRLFETQKDSISLAKAYNDMALIYNGGLNEDYPKAISFFKKARPILLANGDTALLCIVNTNMAYAYQGIKEYDSAATLLTTNIAWQRKNNDKRGVILDLGVLSSVFVKQKKYEEALQASEKSLNLSKEFGNIPTTIKALEQASYVNALLKNGSRSVQYAYEGLRLTRQINAENSELTFYRYLDYGYHELLSNSDSAYKYLRLSSSLQNKLLNEKKTRQIVEIEKKYESEKKDNAIKLLEAEQEVATAELNKKRVQQLGLGIIIVLLVVFFTYFFFTNRTKNRLKQELLEQEISDLRGKITGLLENKPDELDLSFESLNNKLNIPLSEREYEVLLLILSGLGNKEIAEKLFVTIHTVKFHLSNIYEKLGVSNRKEALKFVISVS